MSAHREDCPFCQVAAERVVGESPLTLAMEDAFPISPGHTLVVPKRHFADLFGASPEEIGEIWQALRRAADDLAGKHHPDGFNVGEAAGQTVMHLHVHLIPRYSGDQPDPRGGIRRIFPELSDYWSPKER